MTDKELKKKLLAKVEELEAKTRKMGEHAAELAKYHQARIEKLEALVEEAFWEGHNRCVYPEGLDQWEGSNAKEASDRIKGTEDAEAD